MKQLLCAGVVFFTLASLAAQPAEIVVHNALIWTGDKANPSATAMASKDGKLIYIGDDAGVKPFISDSTQVMDASGKRIVPGFFDCHVHFFGGGQFQSQVQLYDAANPEEFGKRLAQFDKKLSQSRWILGGNWDHDRTFKGKLPTKADIDRNVGTDRLVFIRRYDGHMALANSLVLKLAGITAETPDPPGGEIVRLPGSKEPSGILRDNAMDLVTGKGIIPSTSDEDIAEAILAALKEARKLGVTSIDDMDGSGTTVRNKIWKLYQSLESEGKLTCRIRMFWPLENWQEAAKVRKSFGSGTSFLRIDGVKGFMDGSLGSSTAKMFTPFVNEPNQRGQWVTEPGKMRELVYGADGAGLQVVVHAIGDEANATLLDIFGETAQKYGERDRRFRIEHAQHLRKQDYARFQRFKVIPSLQPYHVIDDGRWAEGRIGKERCATSYANRSLLDAGAKLAFGSDWGVAPMSPLLGIDAAVNRRTLDGKHQDGWFPEQKITIEEALRAYTHDAAYACFVEHSRGSLSLNKLADWVMLDIDILDQANRDRISQTKVLKTVIGGKVVHE